MKKLLISILLLLTFASPSWAAGTCVAAATGNWSAHATWSQTNGGTTGCTGTVSGGYIPGHGDAVDVNAYVVTVDEAAIPGGTTETGNCTATTANQGTCALASLTSSTTSGTPANNGSMNYTLAASTWVLNVTGNIQAGYKPSTAGLIYVSGSSGTLNITAQGIIGGANTSANGIYNAATTTSAIINFVGNVTGGSGPTSTGIYNNSSGTVNITGTTVTGGSGGGGDYGFFNSLTGIGTITANVQGGTVTSSSGGCPGVDSSGNGNLTLVGNIIDTAYGMGWTGRSPTWTTTNALYYHQLQDGTKLYADTDPGVTHVQTGTSYYFQSNTIKNGSYSAGGGSSTGY